MWIHRAHNLSQLAAPPTFATPPEPVKTVPRKKNSRGTKAMRREQWREALRKPTGVAHEDFEEDEIGTPVSDIQAAEMKDELSVKYAKDRAFIRDEILKFTDGCLPKIKELRWLLASVQTWGQLDGVCLMAEFAMNEFNFKDGVLDRILWVGYSLSSPETPQTWFSTLVGPWALEGEIARTRASFHSNATHRIPLDTARATIDKRQLMAEILGRCEPKIAAEHELRVGLYTEEAEELDVSRGIDVNKNPPYLADERGRRWVLCLRQEFHDMVASCHHMNSSEGFDYDGFPRSADRFVLVDAFVDAVCDVLGGRPLDECHRWISALGTHLPEEFATPWERSGELFCNFHRNDRNSCCASVTVSRATFIMLHSLHELLEE